MFNQAGQVLSTTDYRPFGSPLTGAGITSRTTYIDRERDAETSLGSYGVRLYDAELGRFTSVDPLWGLYEGLQPYQYAGNSPVGNLDASGLLVQAVDECAQSAIRTSVEWAYRSSIEFGDDGVLNVAKLTEAAAGKDASSNIFRLAAIAQSSETISVEVASRVVGINSFGEREVSLTGPNRPNDDGTASAILGATLLPKNSQALVKPLSSMPDNLVFSNDDAIRIVLRDDHVKGAKLSIGQVAAHEMFLHAYHFLQLKAGANVSPLHTPKGESPPTIVDVEENQIEANVNKAE